MLELYLSLFLFPLYLKTRDVLYEIWHVCFSVQSQQVVALRLVTHLLSWNTRFYWLLRLLKGSCCFVWSDWTDGNHCNNEPVFNENVCWIALLSHWLFIVCLSLWPLTSHHLLSSRSHLPVWHSGEDIQSCVWWRRCYRPSPNWNRKDFLLCHSLGGEAPERCSGTNQRPGSQGRHTTPVTGKLASVSLNVSCTSNVYVWPGLLCVCRSWCWHQPESWLSKSLRTSKTSPKDFLLPVFMEEAHTTHRVRNLSNRNPFENDLSPFIHIHIHSYVLFCIMIKTLK